MEIRPIFHSLRKHRIPAILIVLEIALACAVFCNAVFMIAQRVNEIRQPNAIDEHGLSVVTEMGADPKLAAAEVPRNLAALRQIPGVTAVAKINTMPLSNNGLNANVSTGPGDVMNTDNPNVGLFFFTQGAPRVLGLRLLKGRFFTDAEYAAGKLTPSFIPSGHAALVTRSLAERLWHGRGALGKTLWIGPTLHFTVVGVVADVLRMNQNGAGIAGFHWSVFFPLSPGPNGLLADYLLRSAPHDRARVIRAAVQKLQTLSPQAVVTGQTFTAIRAAYFATTRSMIWILVLVCAAMLAVTAFGIVGLTSFWVRQRRRQIGIRRAVGATRAHILQYFQTENFLLSTAGVALGVILAYAANLYLMQHYQFDRMPWYYLPVSAVALWVLGQLAVLGPALRASNVPPVVATRSV